MAASKVGIMNENEVMALLKDNQDARGIKHWNAGYAASSGLQSYGIGLTRLRKMAKGIGRDRALSQTLWTSDWYDARVISLLIDDPKALTEEQAERQVDELGGGELAHVFSSCDATLAKAPFVKDIAERWMGSDDPMRKRCGYGLCYELSKSKKKSAPDEQWFLGWIAHIDRTWRDENVKIRMSMAGALMGAGKRSKTLNAAALKVANDIGPIEFDPTGKCDPFDIRKHLTSDYLKKKLGL